MASQTLQLLKRDLRMLELQLIFDVNVLVACVLELFDEAIGLLLRYAVCSESPALNDLEDMGIAVSLIEQGD